MADGTSRAGNALQKRQESLKRWKGSETDRQPVDRSKKKNKIKFNAGTVFLSAVSSDDVDEVKKLLAKGTDINFQNVDGLTALHQACIDETFDLVKILVTNGARLDMRDNEGWTPLHAAASCGSVEIAKYLIEKGADVAAVNNEGELPLDLAEEEDMEDVLTDEIERLGIDAEEARNVEEKLMLEDAQSWLNKNSMIDLRDRTGATALHVAASKGYLKVMALLLQLNVDPNEKDNDGWTPLHAAAHWGQTEACEVLADNGGDFTIRNKVGQTPIDLAEPDMVKILEELKKRQNDKSKIKENTPRIKSNLDSNAPPPLKRSTSSGFKDPPLNNDNTDYDIAGLMSSITRIKSDNLSYKDKSSEKKTLEENRNSPNVSKLGYIKKPNFPESPKEDKEKEKPFEYGQHDSESESSETETNSEEGSSEENTTPVTTSRPLIGKNPSMNSLPNKSIGQKQPVKYKSSESDSVSESEEEQKPATARTNSRPNQFSTTTNSRMGGGVSYNTPATGTSPTSRQQSTTATSRLKSRFLDQDKDKKTAPFSPASKGNSRYENSDLKDETPSSRLGSYPVRTTASTTSTSTTSTIRDRTSSATSSDKDETTTTKRKHKKAVRSGTTYVAKLPDNEDDEDNDSKDNDAASKDAPKDTKKDSTGSSTDYVPRRHRQLGTNADKSVDSSTSKRAKLPEQNKENEEVEMSSWKKKRLEREREREREREQRERDEKEKELAKEKEKEREKEKEKDKESDFSSYRRRRPKVSETNSSNSVSRRKEENEKEVDNTMSSVNRRQRRKPREVRRATGVIYMPSEESGDDSQDSKKNTRSNEELEHRSLYRSRKHNQDSDDSKSSERIRSSRATPTVDSRVPTSTTRDNTTAESRVALSTGRDNTTAGSRAPLSTTRGNTPIQITETDPKKLREQLQEAHLELQQYKVKLETTTQEKEKLEQKLTQLTEDLKQLTDLKNENQRLKDENGALIRVISKLSKPPT